ncbi:MAG: ComEC/Rec2 family competence protein, partial [Candidatus Saccharimonas sp.]
MWRLTTKVHQTWHLTAICFGFIGGVVLAMSYSLSTGVGLTVGLVCVVLAFWKRYRVFLMIAVLGGICLGLVRGSIGVQALSEYRNLYGHQASIEGIVAEDVDTVNGSARLRLNHVEIGNHSYQGQVWVTARSGGESVRRSDVVKVNGMISEGFGNFAASVVGGRVVDVHRPVPGDVALEVRDAFASDVRETISEPGASLGLGFLLGQKNALPTDLLEALKITGLTHIVVASGYNLTILVRIGRRLFAKLSKYLAV